MEPGRPGPRVVTMVYGASAVAAVLSGLVGAVLTRNQFSVPSEMLLSDDLYQQVQREQLVDRLLVVALPVIAAVANMAVPRVVGANRVAWRRAAVAAPWIWLVGLVLLEASWWVSWSGDVGWFNYAPNAAVTFPRSGVATAVHLVGLLAAISGLAITAATLCVTALHRRRPGDPVAA